MRGFHETESEIWAGWIVQSFSLTFNFLKLQLYVGSNVSIAYCSNRNSWPRDLYKITLKGMEEETSKTFRPSPCWGQNLSELAFEKKNPFFTTILQCVSKIETYHCRNFKRALTPMCKRNPWRAELETLSLCYVWSPIITPTRYIGGLSKETAPPPPRSNERQCSGSFHSVL